MKANDVFDLGVMCWRTITGGRFPVHQRVKGDGGLFTLVRLPDPFSDISAAKLSVVYH